MQKRELMFGILVLSFILIASMGIILAANDDTTNGSTEDTTTNGSTSDTTTNGSTEDTTINGSTEDTTTNGSTEDTTTNGSTEDTTINGSTEDTTKVCCYSYGYGANMQKVNSEYKLMDKEECVVEEDWVGGGKEIVAQNKCQEGYTNKIKAAIKEKNKFKFNSTEVPENCTKTGSAMKCYLNGSRIMTVYAGNSGNVIIQTKGINASTTVQLYKDANGTLYAVSDNNETIPINYLPDEIKERIKERTRARLNATNMIINGECEYEYEAEKEARFLGLFKVKEKMSWKIDAETGEIKNENAPWWGFLANDIEEDNTNTDTGASGTYLENTTNDSNPAA